MAYFGYYTLKPGLLRVLSCRFPIYMGGGGLKPFQKGGGLKFLFRPFSTNEKKSFNVILMME